MNNKVIPIINYRRLRKIKKSGNYSRLVKLPEIKNSELRGHPWLGKIQSNGINANINLKAFVFGCKVSLYYNQKRESA
jgi:hypothetical protein